ncbi:MAG: AAA family ATPase, partial [Planctomycetaceae bacterium]
MSRYTRALRKQARAQAQNQHRTHAHTGSPALLEAPGTTSLRSASDVAESDFDGGTTWTRSEPPTSSLPTQVQALAPATKARHPGPNHSPRKVIAGREVTSEIQPGHRRQPLNDGWVWRDKILAGDLVVIVGEECSGKTRVLTDWIARITAGQAFPGSENPSQVLPPSDVLVFNCIDNFQHAILDQVKLNGGNPDRVLQASAQLLDWGHSHSEFPEEHLPGAGGERPETRVRLHTQEILRKLEQFLLRRPSIRLVVIDQLKQHLKFDSERVFEELIYELQILARYTRALRKQARAQAQNPPRNPAKTGSTALLDAPETPPLGSLSDPAGSDFDPGTSWTPSELDTSTRPTPVQALAPVAKAKHPGSSSPTRRVIPGREVAPETRPGHRRQPHNEGWLWRDEIRAGDLVVIVGEECSGKTRVLTDWIARVTAGQPFPGITEASDALPPSDVLVFNCVDDFQHSILNQVKLNGGNPDRVLQASTQLL